MPTPATNSVKPVIYEDIADDWEFAGWTECDRTESCPDAWECGGYGYEFYDKEHPKTFMTKCCADMPMAFDVFVPRGYEVCHWVYCRYMDDEEQDCGEHCLYLGRLLIREEDTKDSLKVCPQSAFDDEIEPNLILITPELMDAMLEEDYDSEVEKMDEIEDAEEDLPYPTAKDFEDDTEFQAAMADFFPPDKKGEDKRYGFIRWEICIPVNNCGHDYGMCTHRHCILAWDRLEKRRVSLCDYEQDRDEIDCYELFADYQRKVVCGYAPGHHVPVTRVEPKPKPKIRVMFFERTNPTPNIKMED
jgi:hypothetical protein